MKIYFPNEEYLSNVNKGYSNFLYKITTVDYNVPLCKKKNTFKYGLIKKNFKGHALGINTVNV